MTLISSEFDEIRGERWRFLSGRGGTVVEERVGRGDEGGGGGIGGGGIGGGVMGVTRRENDAESEASVMEAAAGGVDDGIGAVLKDGVSGLLARWDNDVAGK